MNHRNSGINLSTLANLYLVDGLLESRWLGVGTGGHTNLHDRLRGKPSDVGGLDSYAILLSCQQTPLGSYLTRLPIDGKLLYAIVGHMIDRVGDHGIGSFVVVSGHHLGDQSALTLIPGGYRNRGNHRQFGGIIVHIL